jgi:ornithine--oxo-acid transaminase
MIGYDIMYNKGEGCYLSDVDEQRYLDFLGGRGAFHLGRNHPDVRRVIHETLEWCTPNMVQMDWPLLSGSLAEALVERVGEPAAGASLQRRIRRRAESEGK